MGLWQISQDCLPNILRQNMSLLANKKSRAYQTYRRISVRLISWCVQGVSQEEYILNEEGIVRVYGGKSI